MIPFSPAKFAQMQQEHKRLTQERVLVMERIKVAREQGDLSENGAYQYGKFELGNINRRLQQLARWLADGEPRERPLSPTRVDFGCLVTLQSATGTITYDIVSEFESDPAARRLSWRSPLGRVLVGKKVGDKVEFTAPAGQISYTITAITGR